MKNIDMLWELQQLDNKIIDIEKEAGIYSLRDDIEKYKQSYNRLLIATKQKAEEYKEKDARALELKAEVEQALLDIEASEEKLNSGEVIKPKALSTLQKEIEDFHKLIEADNKELEGLKTDNINNIKQIKRCKAKLEHIKEMVNTCNTLLDQKMRSTEEDLAKIQNEIEEVRKTLLPEEVKFYYGKKENLYPVLVPYIEENCEGCKMQFSLMFSQAIQKNKPTYTTCENCGRLIVMSKEVQVQAEA